MPKLKTLLVLATLSLAGAAYAQSGAPADEGQQQRWRDNPQAVAMRQACAADAERLCPNLRGQERRSCMQSRAKELSKPCADARDALKAAMRAKGYSPPAAAKQN